MISRIPSGIPGLDILTSQKGEGGIPDNTVTLVYGPPKVGKSIFCYQFMNQGLLEQEPCLYICTDYGIKQFKQNTKGIGLELDKYFQKEYLYLIDAISSVSGTEIVDNPTYLASSVHNPTDIIVKLGVGTRLISHNHSRFRSILDSLTTLMAFNDEMLIIRVLTAYIMRIKEDGGTAIVTYTRGTGDSKLETMLKAIVDNIIYLDGENIIIEAMEGLGSKKSTYKIDDNGIVVNVDE